jgi:hypothetical protein
VAGLSLDCRRMMSVASKSVSKLRVVNSKKTSVFSSVVECSVAVAWGCGGRWRSDHGQLSWTSGRMRLLDWTGDLMALYNFW